MMITPDGHPILPNTGEWRWIDHDTIELVGATVLYNVSKAEELSKQLEVK